MAELLKVGVVGCGGIANAKHLPAIKVNGMCQVVATCDIIRERAEKAAKEYGTPLMLMDEALVRSRCREYKNAMASHLPAGSKPLYASKAFAVKRIYEIMKEENMGVDVVSSGELYTAVKKIYESSDTVEAIPDRGDSLRLIFCMGGTAPETSIPAYQLPNATLYGVYTLFPDDTGWYGDNLITAHVHSFRLKEGSFEVLRALAGQS